MKTRKITPNLNRTPKISPDRGERYTCNPMLVAAFEKYGCPLINNFCLTYWASPDTPERNLGMVCDRIEEVLTETFPCFAGRVN